MSKVEIGAMEEEREVLAAEGITIKASLTTEFAEILTLPALQFVAALVRKFAPRRVELLAARKQRQVRIDAGEMPDFLAETAHIRAAEWQIAPIPPELKDRRVEITGPVDRKMVINALNSGAKVYMADFEDSHSPTWEGTIQGQRNLRDAVNGDITYTSPEGKKYALNAQRAVLMVRPRGWHLWEKQVEIDGQPISGGLFDFGLFFFHNAKKLLAKGSGPYFYLPKLENHLEARLWNDVFSFAEEYLAIAHGTIKATVLIETILAAFEMDEILYELRDHSAGLNCGRWDYIFSFIKKFQSYTEFVLPDRARVTMTTHFLHSYSLLLIQTCHRRGAHAMGGMAAQIPVKDDAEINRMAMEKVVADKRREAGDGHDGTWVAHPGLVPIAMKEFDTYMPTANQLTRLREDVKVTAADLLTVPKGDITVAGLRTNINVGILYLESWLKGLGCVPLYNLMEDAATAEISRAQVWQWIKHGVQMTDGCIVTQDLVKEILNEELEQIKAKVGESAFLTGKYTLAAELFAQIATGKEFVEFLTLPAYEYL
jgi:malate synthase